MMDNKLSELSKPVAWEVKGILCHSEEEARIYVGDPEPLYSQEYVSALLAELEAKDKRIAELEAKTAMTMGVGSGNGNLFVHGDYDSIKAAQAIVLENESLRAKLATPVRMPRRAPENLASVLDGYEKWLIATTFRDTWNACLDEVSRASSGFTVEGGMSINGHDKTHRQGS